MKINELRIGNLVDIPTGINRITSICHVNGLPHVCFINLMSEVKYNYGYDLDECNPIPLTEELLLNLGFVKYCDNWHIKVDKNALNDIYKGWFTIYDEFDGSYSIPMGDYRNDTNASIRYVHQLQNLYFALTGEELSL